ncbi:MAG: hypothetical protein KKH28_07215 [Elusimicrobia bacterium]|nr:hypothetical protein [Elusimicrobiota bacterium]
MKHKILISVAALALAAHLLMGFAFIKSAAPTYDEPVHLSSGYSYLATGRYIMNIMDHPPLSEMASALPLLCYRPSIFSNHTYFMGALPYHYGDLFLYQNVVDAEKMLNAARVFSFILWGAVFAVFIGLFAFKTAGFEAAVFSVAAFALLPVFISNNALVTTDAAPAAFYFASFCLGCMFARIEPLTATLRGHKVIKVLDNKKHYRYAALTGLATGLAMASKFSMFVLPPLVIGMWILHNILEPKIRLPRLLWYAAVYLAAALLTLAVVYKFDLALYFDGLRETFKRLDQGRSSFIWGTHSIKGVWWYFPVALTIKTPVAALLLAFTGLAVSLKRFKKEHLWLLLPPLCYFASASFTRVQIGFRHIMPVMPFLAVFAGLGAAYLKEKKALLWVFVPLIFLWIWGLARTGPYYLEYFNELAGGPKNGYKYLVDSNLDWGQGIKPLGSYLKERGNPPVILSYFGVAKPEYYGIKYFPLKGGLANVEINGTGEDLCALKRPLLAVSATNLQGVYFPDRGVFDWLKKRKPLFTAGYSIFLYDLTGDKEGLDRLSDIFDSQGLNREADCLRGRIKDE